MKNRSLHILNHMEITLGDAKKRNSEIVFKNCLWTIGLGIGRKEMKQKTHVFFIISFPLLFDFFGSTNDTLMKAG